MIFDYASKNGSISYKKEDGRICIDGYRGKDTILCIPEKIEDCPVTKIGKKAFLGAPELVKLQIPASVQEIGDYAFAGCGRLREVSISYGTTQLGRNIFTGCDSLEALRNIAAEENSKKWEDVAYLLVAAAGLLEAPYLFDLTGDFQEDWFTLWDNRMESKIGEDDAEGFQNMLLCGEEDYGSKETDFEYYKHVKRMQKVKIVLLRMLHDYGLSPQKKEMAKGYLLSHIKGCTFEETWETILKEHGDDRKYFDFLFSLGGVTKDNYEGMLRDLGDRHTEMKAHLIKYYESTFTRQDVFSMFDL